MKITSIVKNKPELMALLSKIESYPIKITITDDTKKRSLPANAAQHVFYKAISEYTGEDIKTTGHRMKRDLGLPILLSGDCGEKAAWLLDKLEFYSRTESQQLNMMEFIPVTSLFTSKQHNLYRDNLQSFWRDNGLTLDYKHG